MKLRISLVFTILLLSSCAGFAEMGETGQMPRTTRNQARALLQSYCEFPVFHNIEEFAVRAIQVLIPSWDPTCDAYRDWQEMLAEAPLPPTIQTNQI